MNSFIEIEFYIHFPGFEGEFNFYIYKNVSFQLPTAT